MKKSKKALIITLVALGVALITAIGVCAYVILTSGSDDSGKNDDNKSRAVKYIEEKFDIDEDEKVEIQLADIEETNGKEIFNILVMGVDKSTKYCDSVMLIRYVEEQGKVMVMSIPRDTYVNYGGKTILLNSVYGEGKNSGGESQGISAMAKTVSAFTGLDVNYYIKFETGTFARLVDAFGGIEFDVPMNMDYEDPAQGLSIHIKKGKQVLSGEDAEKVARYRSGYVQGDLQRVKVQQDLLVELFKQKLKPEYIAKTPVVYNLLKEDIDCNMPLTSILKFGKSMLKLDFSSDIYTCTMPTVEKSGDLHLYQDRKATDEIIETYFYAEGPITN